MATTLIRVGFPNLWSLPDVFSAVKMVEMRLGWGSAPDPLGAYNAPPDFLTGLWEG